MRASRTRVAIVGIVLAVCAGAALAQDFGFRGRRGTPIQGAKAPYDGSVAFTFARLRHGMEFGFEPPWAHDYPRAERNFSRILKEITLVSTNLTSSNVYRLDDPDLFTSPVAYVSEPGYMTMNDEELALMQAYIRKGGFLIFDDFRDEHWHNFEEQVRRMVPNARIVQLDETHPIFRSFFNIRIEETQGYYGKATFHGVFEDNDPTKRLLLIAGYNHDLGELWEFSDTGLVPVDLSNDAYKYGVNYIIYAMTH